MMNSERDTIQVELIMCFGCGDYYKAREGGLRRDFCGRCGHPVVRKIFDVENPAIGKAAREAKAK